MWKAVVLGGGWFVSFILSTAVSAKEPLPLDISSTTEQGLNTCQVVLGPNKVLTEVSCTALQLYLYKKYQEQYESRRFGDDALKSL